MKRLSAALGLLVAALALAGSARADVRFGVAEDAGKYAPDGGASFFSTLDDLGMTENRITVYWDPAHPDEIQERSFLDHSLPQAALRGVRILFSVQPRHPTDVTSTRDGPRLFAEYCALLARTYPQVKDFVIGNEPNQPRFWRPQFVRGRGVSAAAYERTLALAYDALKAVDPSVVVIGLGLSPRGNDNPKARNNISTSPVRFLHDLGVAYRASGRTRPLMDQLAFHPYPNPGSANDPLWKGYRWPNAGVPNLGRIEQAVWDAFAGTAQPTFAEPDRARRPAATREAPAPLTFVLDETGWQVRIPASHRRAYRGRESSKTVSEATQARIYGDLVRYVSCDPSVASLDLFHLVDERNLDRFQSGLVRADGTRRASYGAVKAAIAATHGRCAGNEVTWRHLTGVEGAGVDFSARVGTRFGFAVTAKEGARYRAGIFRADAFRGLASRDLPPSLVASTTGTVRPYRPTGVEFPESSLPPGRYVYALRLSATMNPGRTSLLVGRPFRVR